MFYLLIGKSFSKTQLVQTTVPHSFHRNLTYDNKLKRTIEVVKEKSAKDVAILLPAHMIIVFTCNIKRLCVNIFYRLFF